MFDFRQSVKYQSLVEDRLRHTDIAFSLCEDLYTSVQNCIELAQQIQQAGLQVHSSSVKILNRLLFFNRDGDCDFFWLHFGYIHQGLFWWKSLKCFYIKGQLISLFLLLFVIGNGALSRIQAFPKSNKDV